MRRPAAVDPPSWGTGPIGIWEPVLADGVIEYVRGQAEPRKLWADVDRIGRKSRRRVVLIGESVARGYFYDPHYGPAGVLEGILRAHARLGSIDVVDLARTNIGLRQLRSLTTASLALEPDALVIFAGNNWGPFNGLDFAQQRRLIPLLVEPSGWPEAKELLEHHLRQQIEALFAELGETGARSVPVVFVLPEFNLADWRGPRHALPLLAKNEVLAWRALLADGERALCVGDIDAAERHAHSMVGLDRGTVARPFEIIAECMRRTGRTDERRRAFESARDSEFMFPRAPTPRCFGATESAIRCQAANYRIPLVDLPARLQTRVRGGIPDRSLFLDYCHLTYTGIQLAMAAVGEAVLEALGDSREPWTELQTAAKAPDREMRAMASLFAAHHNSILEQPAELVEHHCREALQHDAGIAGAMSDLMDLQIRRAPMALCGAFQRLRRSAGRSIDYYCDALDGAKLPKLTLMHGVTRTLRCLDPASATGLEELWRAEHGCLQRPANLLETYYRKTVFSRTPEWTRLGYYRAYGCISEFVVPLERESSVRVSVTLRVRDMTSEGEPIAITTNDRTVRTLSASHAWRTTAFRVDREKLVKGLNIVAVKWPIPNHAWRRDLPELLQSGEIELGTGMYPIFGEIARFEIHGEETAVHDAHTHGSHTRKAGT